MKGSENLVQKIACLVFSAKPTMSYVSKLNKVKPVVALGLFLGGIMDEMSKQIKCKKAVQK